MFIFTLKKYNYDVCTFKTLSLKKYNQMKNIKFSDLFCEYIGGNRIKYMDISRIMLQLCKLFLYLGQACVYGLKIERNHN